MATSVARKAALPAGATLVKAWAAMPPKLCAAKTEPAEAPVVHLPCENGPAEDAAAAQGQQQLPGRNKPAKSFQMHVGGSLHIPTKNAQERPQLAQPAQAAAAQAVVDPFEGLPFRNFAERLGETMLPTLQAAREAERKAKLAAIKAPQEMEVVVPPVPHVLPFTRWAANSESFRSTFIADPPKQRKKARLSWYHPDDTMVPRDWWRSGLLADIKYYMPFGLGADSSGSAAAASK